MAELIIDDRTSPEQKIRKPADRRHEENRRHNPFSGTVQREDEHRHGAKNRRSSDRRDEEK